MLSAKHQPLLALRHLVPGCAAQLFDASEHSSKPELSHVLADVVQAKKT
jgi:hypothetical protein